MVMSFESNWPKVIVTASCGVEPSRIVAYVPIVERALELTPEHIDPEVIIFNRPQVCESSNMCRYI